MELSLVRKDPIPTCLTDLGYSFSVQPRKQTKTQEFSNADRDKCLTNILLSKWQRYLQVYVCEEVRKDQAHQRVVREITERQKEREEEWERRHSRFSLYCLATNLQVLRVMSGAATEIDV